MLKPYISAEAQTPPNKYTRPLLQLLHAVNYLQHNKIWSAQVRRAGPHLYIFVMGY